MSSFFFAIFQYLEELFTSRLPFFPSNIRAALFIILFCMVGFSELYLFIFLRRTEQGIRRKRDKIWSEKLTNILANIIVYGDEEDTTTIVEHFLPRLQRLPIHRLSVRKILVKEMLAYNASFTGTVGEVLRELYLRLKLDKVAKKNLNNRYWEIQIEAIRELTQMRVRDITDKLLKYSDDENGQLRMEAQAAFLKLSTTEPFRFLDRARERILDWHQLVLFEVITKTEDIEIPSFSKWLTSANDTVVMLCLKLVSHYQQLDAIPQLIQLLSHPNLLIRIAAIRILGKIEAQTAEETMLAIYFDEPVEVRIEILEALGLIASGEHMEFLRARTRSDEFKLRMSAMRSIRAHGRGGKELLNTIYSEETLQNKAIIKHVLDERIK